MGDLRHLGSMNSARRNASAAMMTNGHVALKRRAQPTRTPHSSAPCVKATFRRAHRQAGPGSIVLLDRGHRIGDR